MYSRDIKESPIVEAIKSRNYELVKSSLKDIKNINDTNDILKVNYLLHEFNYNLLMLACEIGDKDIIELFLKKGAKVNSFSYQYSPNSGDKEIPIDSPLSIACKYNDNPDEIIKLLIEYNVDASIPNNKPLWIISRQKPLDKDNVKLLLDNGATDNYIPFLQESSVSLNKYLGSGSILLDIWSELDPSIIRFTWQFLNPECINPQIKYDEENKLLIKKFLGKKVDFTVRNNSNYNLLYGPYEKNQEEITKLFLENGAKENCIHSHGKTFLEHAEYQKENKSWFLNLFRGNPEALAKLLKEFSDEKLAFTNHAQEAMSYEKFMCKVNDGWNIIDKNLLLQAPVLHGNIYKFFFSEKLGKKDENNKIISWGDNITIGFSSPKLKEWCDDGYSMLDYYLEDSSTTLKDIMTNNFKKLIVVKDLKTTISTIAKQYQFKVNIDTIQVGKFFTDVLVFEKLIKQIFSEIDEADKKANKDNTQIKITATSQDADKFIEIRIIHINSKSPKSVQEQLKKGGGLQEIEKISSPICYWSIDTICSDNFRYLIDYTSPKREMNEAHYKKIEQSIDGFTYVLRFVK